MDGTGRDEFRADIGIQEGQIGAVGDLSRSPADREIDASGMLVTPGFIDIHSHSDFTILFDPTAPSKILQGVTTEVIGQCGSSAAPLRGEKLARAREQYPDLDIDWKNLAGYRRRVEAQGTSVNLVPLTGHGNLRGSVIGYGGRGSSKRETAAMISMLEGELAAGSRGLSSGLVYPPGNFADFEELSALLRAIGAEGIYSTHMRSESDRLEEAVGEAISLAEETGVSLQISHLKAQGKRNWDRLEKVIGQIDAARSAGVNLHCDRYPYLASATDLDILLPAWATEGGTAKEMERLRDPALRPRLAAAAARDDWSSVVVSRVMTAANRRLEGMNMNEIANLRKQQPLDCFFDILIEEECRVEALFFGMKRANLEEILRKPYTMIGSDASARAVNGPLGRGRPHPRTFGTFPLIFERFVGSGILGLEEAVFKMTGLPAGKLNLTDRGIIRAGAAADLVIFDPARIRSRATYRNPKRYPEGIAYVIVNGETAAERGELTGRLPGRFI